MSENDNKTLGEVLEDPDDDRASWPVIEPTDDSVPDGTQIPDERDDMPDEEGDAGVNDTGDEPWYDDEDAD